MTRGGRSARVLAAITRALEGQRPQLDRMRDVRQVRVVVRLLPDQRVREVLVSAETTTDMLQERDGSGYTDGA